MSEELPKVISESVLEIMGNTLRCYVLSNGKRVFDKDDVDKFFGGDLSVLFATITKRE